MPVPHHPLAPVRKLEIGKLRDKGVRLRLQRFGEHPPRAFARDLRQCIIDRIGLTESHDRGSLLHGVSLLREVLAVSHNRHDTLPSHTGITHFPA
jgi:hypothetical protein